MALLYLIKPARKNVKSGMSGRVLDDEQICFEK